MKEFFRGGKTSHLFTCVPNGLRSDFNGWR
jgi:hypothetical protein